MNKKELWDIAMKRKTMSKKLANKIIKLKQEGYTWRAMVEKITNGQEYNQALGMKLERIANEVEQMDKIKIIINDDFDTIEFIYEGFNAGKYKLTTANKRILVNEIRKIAIKMNKDYEY
jgi:hypothetical protein